VIRFSDAWKICFLALLIVLGAPVFLFMGGEARGEDLTPGGVPINTTPGTYFDMGGNVKGTWGYHVVVGEGYFEFLVAPPSAYFNRNPPATGTIVYYLPSGDQDMLSAATMASVNTHAGNAWTGAILLDPPFMPDTINGKNLIQEMLLKGEFWDIDKDGDVDWRDVALWGDDMDQDGIPNADDADADGDGESNFSESVEPESANASSYKQYNPFRFPDRDGDTLPDLVDSDNDGWANFLEKFAGTSPTDANDKPASGFQLNFADAESGAIMFAGVVPSGFWPDSDGDGAWDWLETLYGTDINDPYSFHDGNGDGHWDWTGALRLQVGAPIVAPDPDDPVPVPPVQTPPITMPSGGGQNAGGAASDPAGGAAGTGATSGNTVDGTGNPGAGSEQPEPSTPSASGTGAVVRHFAVIQKPRGNSSAFQGVGGGTWQQRSSMNYGYVAGQMFDASATKADVIANVFLGVQVSGTQSHVLALPIKWIDGTTKTFNVPLMPDAATEWGAIAENVRGFLRAIATLFVTYVFIRSVWSVLQQA
jgi:hypothetical protein